MRASLFTSVVVLTILGGAAFGAAEPPTWEQVSAPLYAEVRHCYPASEPYKCLGRQGLWAFDPGPRTWRRVMPLLYNAFAIGSWYADGGGAILQGSQDVLVFEAAMAWLDLEPVAGRVLRRYHPGFINGAWGWSTVGLVVREGDNPATGLRPGTYGLPTCMPAHLGYRGGGGITGCGPISYPAGAEENRGLRLLYFTRQQSQRQGADLLADLRWLPEEWELQRDLTSSPSMWDPVKR